MEAVKNSGKHFGWKKRLDLHAAERSRNGMQTMPQRM